MEIKFHEKSFRLLPSVPAESKEAIAALNQVEERIGKPLPASVREWYSFHDACSILERYSNSDTPVKMDRRWYLWVKTAD
jgi:cell wall assembly regulator SMI1